MTREASRSPSASCLRPSCHSLGPAAWWSLPDPVCSSGSLCLTSLEANAVATAEDGLGEGKEEEKKINFAFTSTLLDTILCSVDQRLAWHIKFLLKQFFRRKPNIIIRPLLDFTNYSHHTIGTRNLSGTFPESKPKCLKIFLFR